MASSEVILDATCRSRARLSTESLPGQRHDYVSVLIQPGLVGKRQSWGLEQILHAAGVPYRFESSARPDIYYGFDPRVGRGASLWIPTDIEPGCRDSALREPIRLLDNRFSFDLGNESAYWLSLESESRVRERDEHGRVPAASSMLNKQGLMRTPPIQTCARLLVEAMVGAGLRISRLPTWPGGKRYAVVLTHDVDAPERPAAGIPLFRRMLTGNGSTRMEAYWALRAEVRRNGLRESCFGAGDESIEWDFSSFCELEERYGLRSTFYFSVVPRDRGHACDVSYDAAKLRYRRLYRELATGGWEVGLHAGYSTRLGKPEMARQADRLKGLTGSTICGVRHHYLQIDPHTPMNSLLAAAAAGLSYDTSIGFNDAPGYRAGTALPYFAPPSDSHGVIDLVELPMTIADMHLPREDRKSAVRTVLDHLDAARALEGSAVLNWHAGHWHSAAAWRESYVVACAAVAQDGDAWVTTPAELARWWRKRASFLRGD